MARFFKITSFLLCTILSVFPLVSLQAAEGPAIPQDYTAVYRVLRNDKAVAEVTIRLSHQDNIWTLHGFTHDMQGLADWLNVKGVQTATGRWLDGEFIPDNYKFSFSLLAYKTTWQAVFDWPSGIVTTTSKSGDSQMPLVGGAIDPFSLSLNISSQLANHQSPMVVNIVDEDDIKKHLYEVDREESIDTALGCLAVTRVMRIRKNLKRTSLVWYADDHNYIPVLIRHSKKHGNDFKLKIISLDVGGQPVQPVGPCKNNKPGPVKPDLVSNRSVSKKHPMFDNPGNLTLCRIKHQSTVRHNFDQALTAW